MTLIFNIIKNAIFDIINEIEFVYKFKFIIDLIIFEMKIEINVIIMINKIIVEVITILLNIYLI